MPERLDAQDSRQGERGKTVLWVLVGSLALLAIAMIGLLTWNGANASRDYARQSQDASRREITGAVGGWSGTPSSSNSAAVPAGSPAYPQPSADGGAPK